MSGEDSPFGPPAYGRGGSVDVGYRLKRDEVERPIAQPVAYVPLGAQQIVGIGSNDGYSPA